MDAQDEHLAAIEVLVLKLMDGFRYSATDGQIDVYRDVLAQYPVAAVKMAVDRFINGDVARDNGFCPQAPEVAVQARLCEQALAQARKGMRQAGLPDGLIAVPIGRPIPEGYRTIGPTKVNFGHGGDLDLSNLTPAQKDEVFETHRLPPPADSKALPLKSLRKM